VESWGEVKTLPSVGERKKNWGMGTGKKKEKEKKKRKFYFSFPAPNPLRHCHSRPNSPSLQRIQNSGKTLERPPKPPALQANLIPKPLTECGELQGHAMKTIN